MEAREIEARIYRIFPCRGPRTTRMAVEHELVVSDAATGEPVPVALLREATAGASYAPFVGFEPGGQLELSLPPVAGPAELTRQLGAVLTETRADCRRSGVDLHAVPVDPRGPGGVPLQLRSPRYLAMQRHFDTIGPAGRRMMRATASTQLCLDWWPGAAGAEQWRLLHLAAPFLAAAFARSTGPDGRLATWLAVDPARTGFDDRLLQGEDPVGAYAAFAAGATVFTTPGDVEEHLSTLFPPVRPRGRYLEVRFLDVQEVDGVERAALALARLLYDDAHRRLWLRRLAGEQSALATHWVAAAAGDPSTAALGLELAALPTGVAA